MYLAVSGLRISPGNYLSGIRSRARRHNFASPRYKALVD